MTRNLERRRAALTLTARIFVVLAISGPVLWTRDSSGLLGVMALTVVWAALEVLNRNPLIRGLNEHVEAVLVGVVCGTTVDATTAILGALAVPPFTAGLRKGAVTVGRVLTLELLSLLVVAHLASGDLSPTQGFGVFTWATTGLGVGLLAAFVRLISASAEDPLTPYRSARKLLEELMELSGGLSSGLDSRTLGGTIVAAVHDQVPAAALILHVERGGELVPLVSKVPVAGAPLERCHELAAEVYDTGRGRILDGAFAFPLTSGSSKVGVISGLLSPRVDPTEIGLEQALTQLPRTLEPTVVRLDTALLFGAFRDAATAEERRRLARGMHDGLAQDIASMGYLVDALAADPASPEQSEQLHLLRDRITSVVSEVRSSVLTLRTDASASESLGAAVATLARHLSGVSGIPIHLTLDERTSRLAPEVEAEVVLITQEAMNNAVRHARATEINVHCHVDSPRASITVTDNGVGLQQARSDSNGIGIMRERARLIGATLRVTSSSDVGTTVALQVGDQPAVDIAAEKELVS